jgi:hypothetical protein
LPRSNSKSLLTPAKRGRPNILNRKSSTMTICLTQDTHKQLLKYSAKRNYPPATMVRLMVEESLTEHDKEIA